MNLLHLELQVRKCLQAIFPIASGVDEPLRSGDGVLGLRIVANNTLRSPLPQIDARPE